MAERYQIASPFSNVTLRDLLKFTIHIRRYSSMISPCVSFMSAHIRTYAIMNISCTQTQCQSPVAEYPIAYYSTVRSLVILLSQFL
jgi:hypothetical protein